MPQLGFQISLFQISLFCCADPNNCTIIRLICTRQGSQHFHMQSTNVIFFSGGAYDSVGLCSWGLLMPDCIRRERLDNNHPYPAWVRSHWVHSIQFCSRIVKKGLRMQRITPGRRYCRYLQCCASSGRERQRAELCGCCSPVQTQCVS